MNAPGRPKPLGAAELRLVDSLLHLAPGLAARLRGVNNAYRKLLKEQPK